MFNLAQHNRMTQMCHHKLYINSWFSMQLSLSKIKNCQNFTLATNFSKFGSTYEHGSTGGAPRAHKAWHTFFHKTFCN